MKHYLNKRSMAYTCVNIAVIPDVQFLYVVDLSEVEALQMLAFGNVPVLKYK